MITAVQLRAARGLLDWSRSQCGKIVGLSAGTIKNIEQGKYVPTPDTIEKIVSGFASHGVTFFTQHGVSLRDDWRGPVVRSHETASCAAQGTSA